jgi:hypothetical protein
MAVLRDIHAEKWQHSDSIKVEVKDFSDLLGTFSDKSYTVNSSSLLRRLDKSINFCSSRSLISGTGLSNCSNESQAACPDIEFVGHHLEKCSFRNP